MATAASRLHPHSEAAEQVTSSEGVDIYRARNHLRTVTREGDTGSNLAREGDTIDES